MVNRMAGSAAPPACAEGAILIWRPRGVARRAPRGPSEAERGAGAGPGAAQRRRLIPIRPNSAVHRAQPALSRRVSCPGRCLTWRSSRTWFTGAGNAAATRLCVSSVSPLKTGHRRRQREIPIRTALRVAAGSHGQHKRASTSQEGAWAVTHRSPRCQVLHLSRRPRAVPPRSGPPRWRPGATPGSSSDRALHGL